MERTCRKCKGQKGFYTRGKRSISFGQLISGDTGWKKCDACGGTGDNPKYREKRCERCYGTIGYSSDAKFPPIYCDRCKPIVAAEKQRERESRNRSQQNQRSYQQRPSQPQQRSSQGKQWLEKLCPGPRGGTGCSSRSTIRYLADWNKIPDLCPDCISQLRSQKAQREAQKVQRESNMLQKPCARNGCTNTVHYGAGWDHPPSFCKSCSDKRKTFQAQYPNIRSKFETSDTSYVMPGMGKSVGGMEGTKGLHYPRQGVIHCMVFQGMRGDDLHYSWDVDPIIGEVIGDVYMHHNDPRG